MPTLPPYIHYPSDMVMRAPLQLDNADMYGFFVKGDEAKIQEMVDARLNKAAMGQLQFDVLSPYLMLTFTYNIRNFREGRKK